MGAPIDVEAGDIFPLLKIADSHSNTLQRYEKMISDGLEVQPEIMLIAASIENLGHTVALAAHYLSIAIEGIVCEIEKGAPI